MATVEPERSAAAWLGAIAATNFGLLLLSVTIDPLLYQPWILTGLLMYSVATFSVVFPAYRVPAFEPRVLWVPVVAAVSLGGMYLWTAAHPVPRTATALIVNFVLLSAGTATGAIVGAQIKRPGHILIVAMVITFADIVSVFVPQGLSQTVANSASALSILAVSFPAPASDGAAVWLPTVGVGDIIGAALFIVSTRVHEMSAKRTAVALSTGLLATFAIATALQLALPALPLMSA